MRAVRLFPPLLPEKRKKPSHAVSDAPAAPCCRTDADIRKEQMDAMQMEDGTLESINKSFDPFNALGYRIGADGKTPKSKDLPRVFVLHQGEDSEIEPTSLEDAGIRPGSREFWKAAQRGDLFAYPSGSKDAAQIQFTWELTGSQQPKVSYSKPVDLNSVALSGRLKRPNFFKRMLNGINKNWFKKEIDAYANQERSITKLRESLAAEANARDDALLRRELAATKAEETARYAEKNKKKLDGMVKDAEKRRDRTKISIQYSEAIFEPEPKIYVSPENKEEYEKKYPGRTAGDEIHKKLLSPAGGTGFMDEEQYNDLTQIGKDKLDLDSIRLGNSGRAVTRSEFCALALFTTMSDDIMMNTFKEGPAKSQCYDPSAVDGLHELGYSDKEINALLGSLGQNIFTTDIYIDPPRLSNGRYIKETIDIGRQRTAEAFNAYQNGDLEPLGRLIANGVAKQAAGAAHEDGGFGEEFSRSGKFLKNPLKSTPGFAII